MSNAALALHMDGFNTNTRTLMGRQAAGESFLRGFLRHADVEAFHFWDMSRSAPQAELEALVHRIEPPKRPVRWIARTERHRLGETGVVHLPTPQVAREAWFRRSFGERAYAISGITHTTASMAVMDTLANMIVGPTEFYDALICTSRAVRAMVETELEAVRAYMVEEFGHRRRPEPMRVTIPLGINTADYAPDPAQRAAWRQRLGLGEDDIAVLYVGRFNAYHKMNPALMAMALERAAVATGRKLCWVNVGWADTPEAAEHYRANAAALCPSVRYEEIDGRAPENRFSVWSLADIFISFSDNIQETFGLTPVEAMAAGLPVVVTDWDGY